MFGLRKETHIVPLFDLFPHNPQRTCWCKPTQAEEDSHVWLHNCLGVHDHACEHVTFH